MKTFLLVATLLAVLALALVLVPLFRSQRHRITDGESSPALAALRRQRQEIDEDFARGALSAEERDAAQVDLLDRAGEELREATATEQPGRVRATRPWTIAAALIILLPAIAIPLYLKVGSPAALDPAARAPRATPKDLETGVRMLEKKIEERPTDPEGWILLARSRYVLGRFPDAVSAFEKANTLKPNNSDLLADYADAVAMTQGRSLAGKPEALIQQALKIDPHHRKALALAASAELGANHVDAALGYWQRLQKEFPPGSDEAKQIGDVMDQIKSGRAKTVGPALQPAAEEKKPTASR